MSSIRIRSRIGSGLVLAALVATGCSSAATVASPAPPASRPTATNAAPPSAPSGSPTAGLHLLVLGDSIPFGGHFCPGCINFVDQYAKVLETKSGRPVEVNNLSRDDSATMVDIETQVSEDAATRTAIAASDVVVVSVGYNSLLPEATSGWGCEGDMGPTAETYIAWALAADPACLVSGVATYAEQYDRIFSEITDQREGKPTLYVAINAHDGNLGDPQVVGADISVETRAAFNEWLVGVYDRWNTMLCAKAKEHGFACVDVYHAFNGPKGDVNSDAYTIDHAHPSQAGNDLIAALLAKVDPSTVIH